MNPRQRVHRMLRRDESFQATPGARLHALLAEQGTPTGLHADDEVLGFYRLNPTGGVFILEDGFVLLSEEGEARFITYSQIETVHYGREKKLNNDSLDVELVDGQRLTLRRFYTDGFRSKKYTFGRFLTHCKHDPELWPRERPAK